MQINQKYRCMATSTLKGIIILGLAFFVGRMTVGCAGITLADRTKCTVPWGERPSCATDHDCDGDKICAHRGSSIGRCTLIDCCDPWRDNGRHGGGDNWCKEEHPKGDGSYIPIKNPVN